MNELNRKQVEDVRRSLRPRWYGTRQGRRVAAALGAAALAMIWASAVVCWFLAPSTTAMWITLSLAGIALVTYAGVFSVLIAASDGVVGLAEKNLDERQLAERRHIYTLAHRGSAWMLGVATIVVGLLSGSDHILRVPTTAAFMFMVAIWTTHKITPHLIACWRLEDAPPDDE
ncbi:hypothetical protein [Streptosporangium lutulentum]|uniref:Uncharacterized protein n=1 Tax=Streptosporangium lutulentum TaxID=1461250 RepID=A0ABT9QNE3_9ACTN|nr:hypothetical protein [Streptosporangium lutulentum]MDP9848292.1 hypothetical protein [Streptosporangium lutulentum]